MVIRRVLPPILAAVAALGAGGAASAQELARVTICGQHGVCATLGDVDVRLDAAASVAAPPPEPYYVVTFVLPSGEPGGLLYFRKSNVLGANGWGPGTMVWLPISSPGVAQAMRDAVRDIEPHPAVSSWPRGIKSPYRVGPAPPPAGSRC